MGARQKISLRPLKQTEQQAFQRVAKASSQRLDAIKRAKALLAVAGARRLRKRVWVLASPVKASPNWWSVLINGD